MSKDLKVREDILLRHCMHSRYDINVVVYESVNVGRRKFVRFAILRFKNYSPGFPVLSVIRTCLSNILSVNNCDGVRIFYTCFCCRSNVRR